MSGPQRRPGNAGRPMGAAAAFVAPAAQLPGSPAQMFALPRQVVGISVRQQTTLGQEEMKQVMKQNYEAAAAKQAKLRNLPTVIQDKIFVGWFSQENIGKLKTVNITKTLPNNRDDFGAAGKEKGDQDPYRNTVNDTRMGNPNIREACGYCLTVGCVGHYGAINLHQPIYHPAAIRCCLSLLNSFCLDCGRLFVSTLPDSIRSLPPQKRMGEIEKISKTASCEYRNDNRPKCGARKYFSFNAGPNETGVIKMSSTKGANNADVEDGKGVSPMMPGDAFKKFENFDKEDLAACGFNLDYTHPKDFILSVIPVIPLPSRAPTIQSGVLRNNFLTTQYNEIAKAALDAGMAGEKANMSEVYQNYRILIFGSTKDKKNKDANRAQCIIKQTQGKHSMIRGNIMGQRNNGTARGVAGGAAIPYGTILIPRGIGDVFSKQFYVTRHTKKYLEGLLAEGKVDYMINGVTGVFYDYNKRKRTNVKLRYGDIIGRYLEPGDWVVNNRHPTLSKPSMMAHRILYGVTPDSMNDVTIRHNLCVTPPANMDFDGDELNLVMVVDDRARAEAAYLLHVINIIMSDSQNRPSVGLVVNSILAPYLMTFRLRLIDEALFNRLLNMIRCTEGFGTLFARLAFYGVHPRSGAAIFSALLPPTLTMNTLKKNDKGEFSGVKICRGILIKGAISKKHVGVAHRSIVQEIYKEYGPKRTGLFLTDANFVFNKWITEYGFSCGIKDFVKTEVNEHGRLVNVATGEIENELQRVKLQIENLGGPIDDPQQEEFRQRNVNDALDVTKGLGAVLTKKYVIDDPENRLGIMSKEKSEVKGDVYNMNQLIGISGQQKYDGKPLYRQTRGGTATLPMFDPMSNNPITFGFIEHNYYTGFQPYEVFFAAQGSRSSIVNTTVDTSVTGYMQRKIGKVTEGIIVTNRGAIQNSNGIIFCPVANCGFSISQMLNVQHPFKGTITFFADIKQLAEQVNEEFGWYSNDVAQIIDENREKVKDVLTKQIPLTEGKSYRRKYKGTLGLHRHTRFDKCAIIGRRAEEISNNAPILLPREELMQKNFSNPKSAKVPMYDSVKIAAKEYRKGLLGEMFVLRNNGDIFVPSTPEFLCVQ